jgi:hypothetical protein
MKKKISRTGSRKQKKMTREIIHISCEKSRFYAKKSDFFQMQREARKLLGYFVLLVILIRLDKNADILFSAEHAMYCRSLFVLFLLVIVLSVLLFTVSDYAFGIFNLFFRVN